MIMSFKGAANLLNKNYFLALIIIFIALESRPVFATDKYNLDLNKLSTVQKKTNSLKQIKSYTHPIRNFTIAIPIGAELIERGESVQVSIRSRRGYIINIQSGDANTSLSLLGMITKLEKKYLGNRKPWSHKISENQLNFAGLDAINAIYDGAGTRTEVVIARGLKSDLVIIFFAPVENFEKLKLEFKWFLANFSPDSIELSSDKKNSSNFLPLMPPLKQFSNSSNGFSIKYPEKWIVTKSVDGTIVFFGQDKRTQADQIIVSIQNVRTVAAISTNEVTKKALIELKNSLIRNAENFRVIEEKPIYLILGNLRLSGREIVTTYSYLGNHFKRWSIVIPRPNETIAHIWSYTAPELEFLKFSPIAKTMLQSLIIQPNNKN